MVTFQDRVSCYMTHGINGGCVRRLSIFGLVLVVIGVDGNFDSVVTVGWVVGSFLIAIPFPGNGCNHHYHHLFFILFQTS